MYDFLKKAIKLDVICMKMKLMKNKKIFAAKVFTIQGTCTPNYSRFYVEDQQELRPFYMKIPFGNAFCADSSQVMQVKNQFLCFSYDKTRLKFCASFKFFLAVFMEKLKKNPLCELCEKRNRDEYQVKFKKVILYCMMMFDTNIKTTWIFVRSTGNCIHFYRYPGSLRCDLSTC